ncbi:MAG: uroporphyrinogen decarboxylase family protein [Anaerolineae bacterium]
MDHNSRVRAALRHEAIDRVPYSLWRHYHRQDRTPQGLAAATLELARTYDLDLVKLTPSGLYAVEVWAGGHIVYPGTDHEAPYLSAPAVIRPEEWRQLRPLDPHAGALARELEAIGLVAAGLAGSRPLLMTIFSPLTLAYKLAGERIVEHLRQHPAAVHAALEIVADTTARFARAALEAGADGVFFATQLASHRRLTATEYGEFGARYDMEVLSEVEPFSALTVLHLHGRDVFFELANEYPIQAVSWHDRETAPDLATARGLTDRAFLTGLDRDLLGRGPAIAIAAQAREALGQTKGRGLILAPSCVIPTTAPPAHLRAARDAILANG